MRSTTHVFRAREVGSLARVYLATVAMLSSWVVPRVLMIMQARPECLLGAGFSFGHREDDPLQAGTTDSSASAGPRRATSMIPPVLEVCA